MTEVRGEWADWFWDDRKTGNSYSDNHSTTRRAARPDIGGGSGKDKTGQMDTGTMQLGLMKLDFCRIRVLLRWWIMIVGAADHRLIAAGHPDI